MNTDSHGCGTGEVKLGSSEDRAEHLLDRVVDKIQQALEKLKQYYKSFINISRVSLTRKGHAKFPKIIS